MGKLHITARLFGSFTGVALLFKDGCVRRKSFLFKRYVHLVDYILLLDSMGRRTHGCCVRMYSLVTCDVQYRVSTMAWGQWYAMFLPKKRTFSFDPSMDSQCVRVKEQHGSGTAITAE